MTTKNIVFIATSLDGYIADRNGGLDWLNTVPNPDQLDMGFNDAMSYVDGLIMGRTTFETVCRFDVPWPYTKPVFVLSNTMEEIPEKYAENAALLKGSLKDVLADLHEMGFHKLYIDGGKTIQSFLKEDLIDEMIITTIPVLLGGGFPLFAELNEQQKFELQESKVYLKELVQNHYLRVR